MPNLRSLETWSQDGLIHFRVSISDGVVARHTPFFTKPLYDKLVLGQLIGYL